MDIKSLIFCIVLLNFSMQYAMQSLEKKSIDVKVSTHLNYPCCVHGLLAFLNQLSPNCHAACQKLLEIDPAFMEDYMKIVSNNFTKEEKRSMESEVCKVKCEACKKAMVVGLT